jgi:periplasmic protein TonB
MKTSNSSQPPSSDLLQRLIDNPRRPKKGPGKDVEKHYRLTILAGLVLSLGSLSVLFRMNMQVNDSGNDFDLLTQEVVQMEQIEQTLQEQKPPPPPRPPVPVEVPDDIVFDDVDLDLDATLDLEAEISDLPPPPPTPAKVEEEEDIEIFVVVEQMPEIIGGSQKVYEYLEYPEIARQAGIEGLVVIQVVVNQQGIPTLPEAVRSGGQVLDEAAIKAVMQLRFNPGKQRGKPVQVRLAVPIRFRLRDANK